MLSANQRADHNLCLCCGELAEGRGKGFRQTNKPGIKNRGKWLESGIRTDASGIRTSENTAVVFICPRPLKTVL